MLCWTGSTTGATAARTQQPHLRITQKTAAELGPAAPDHPTTGPTGQPATRNLTATLERLRVDRRLEEAYTHGADRQPEYTRAAARGARHMATGDAVGHTLKAIEQLADV
ncbi:hypothetical protein [Streptomyces spiralis]|uniref:hypothetical protein n=1 Tax=Streptomyces spiralis TaxID=66376 RepID=UPI0036881C58